MAGIGEGKRVASAARQTWWGMRAEMDFVVMRDWMRAGAVMVAMRQASDPRMEDLRVASDSKPTRVIVVVAIALRIPFAFDKQCQAGDGKGGWVEDRPWDTLVTWDLRRNV